MKIRYKKGYKYQIIDDAIFDTGDYSGKGIYPLTDIVTKFIVLTEHGVLVVKAGYAYDGPSGPTLDQRLPPLYKNFMRGSLAHDALYQLMREKHISAFNNRRRADRILRDICREDGMTKLRSWLIYKAVRIGAARSARTGRKIIEAP